MVTPIQVSGNTGHQAHQGGGLENHFTEQIRSDPANLAEQNIYQRNVFGRNALRIDGNCATRKLRNLPFSGRLLRYSFFGTPSMAPARGLHRPGAKNRDSDTCDSLSMFFAHFERFTGPGSPSGSWQIFAQAASES